MKKAFAFACVSLIAVACGDDGGKPHTIPDSKTTVDALVCTGVTGSALDYAGAGTTSMGGAIFWTGQLGTLDGDTLYYDLEFYQGFGDVSGTIDLSAAPQDSYDTCSVCAIAYTLNTDGSYKRAFFQTGGTANIPTDPVTAKNLNATFTGLKFGEADPSTLALNGGACLTYADGTIMHDAVPNAWTCDHAKYNSGGSCGCMCGAIDPDCTDTQATIDGCTGAVACWQGTTCVATRPANDTCVNAQSLAPVVGTPDVKTGTTIGALHNYDKNLADATCTNEVAYGSQYTLKGPDVVYKAALTAGQQYTFALSALDSKDDLAIAVVGPAPATATPETICGNATTPITGCVAGADVNGNGMGESVSYTPTATGLYYIVVDSYSYNIGGTFTLTASTP